jgi:hypothetical protein
MGYYDFEVIQTKTGVPLRAIISHNNKKTTVSFSKTDMDDEYYAEFKDLGIFKMEGVYQIQSLRDYSWYVPRKTIKITTQ